LGGADGIDANGDVLLRGGEVYISGLSRGMDGAIDFDGSFIVTGGSLITAGNALSPSADSSQPVLLVSYTAQYDEGSLITLKDAAGNTLLEYTSRIAFSASAMTSPEMKVGETYTIFIDGEKRADITLTELSTSVSDDGGAYAIQNSMDGGRNAPSQP
jgi:hypothetical protein